MTKIRRNRKTQVRSMDLICVLFIGFGNDKVWPAFSFQIGLGEILSDDTHAEQLYTADKSNDTYQ